MQDFPEQLVDRYRRFKFRHFAIHQDHYERLSLEGQRPEFMIVSCSDSRVDPETIFSAIAGELFVVPKGVEHRPTAEEEVHILLIEPAGTPNTGDPATAAARRVI